MVPKEDRNRLEFEKWCDGFSTAFPLDKDPSGDYLSVLTGNVWILCQKTAEDARREMRRLMNQPSETEDRERPEFIELRDAAIQYTEQDPPKWSNQFYKIGEVRGMLADFAGHIAEAARREERKHIQELRDAAQQLLEWQPICSKGSSGNMRQNRVRAALAALET